MLLAALLCTTVTVAAAAPPPPVSVLLLPLEAKAGVQKDVAEQVTLLLAAQLAKRKELKVLTIADVESVLTRDKLVQAAGCDSASCWTELAGALDTDEVVQGSVGKLGVALVLSISRIKVRTGMVLERVAETITPADASLLILRVPYAARTLYPPTHTARVGRWALIGSLGALGGAALLVGAVSAVGALSVGGIWLADLWLGGTRHLVTQTQGMLLNVLGAGAVVLAVVAVLVGAGVITGAVVAGVAP